MTKLFRKRLRTGAVVTIAVTTPNTIGRVKRFTNRRRQAPRRRRSACSPGADEADEVLTA